MNKDKNIVSDVSQLTTIPYQTLEKLIDTFEMCICHSVLETSLEHENICVCDIGLGTLSLCLDKNSISYKFIPSSNFEKKLINTFKHKTSPLIDIVETTLKDRIVNTYKDLI